MKAALQIEIIK